MPRLKLSWKVYGPPTSRRHSPPCRSPRRPRIWLGMQREHESLDKGDRQLPGSGNGRRKGTMTRNPWSVSARALVLHGASCRFADAASALADQPPPSLVC